MNNVKLNCIGRELKNREPKVSIRILHECNFRCPACGTFSGPNRNGIMSLSDFRKAVDILADEQFRGQLNISGGETSLHPDLDQMLMYVSEKLPDINIPVFTNGHWVGRTGWEERLHSLLTDYNVLIRFSLDKQHAIGAHRAGFTRLTSPTVQDVEKERLDIANQFIEACREYGAQPGLDYDFAFKGTLEEGKEYTYTLGQVPIYTIKFRQNPLERPKKMGFMALDVNEQNKPAVYTTLGHIPEGELMGNLDVLADALNINRRELN